MELAGRDSNPRPESVKRAGSEPQPSLPPEKKPTGALGPAGDPVAGGDDFVAVALAVIERLLSEPRSLLTLLTGAEPEPLNALIDAIATAHPEVEIEVHAGGQPHYPLLIGAE